jgi:hypothetical protein
LEKSLKNFRNAIKIKYSLKLEKNILFIENFLKKLKKKLKNTSNLKKSLNKKSKNNIKKKNLIREEKRKQFLQNY